VEEAEADARRDLASHGHRLTHRSEPYYRRDLALVHDRGYGFHADACAPGILDLLAPLRARDGLVLQFGCGSGLLTEHLLRAGHRVVATDASPAMLAIAGERLRGRAVELRRLTLPEDPLPSADAVVYFTSNALAKF